MTNHQKLISSPRALAYLASRNVELNTAFRFELGYENNRITILHDRLLFPIRNVYGDFLAWQGRALDPTVTPKYWHQSFVKTDHLYGLYENLSEIITLDQVYIVEGNIDVLTMWQCGYPAVALMGSTLSDTQCLLLRRYCSRFVLCVDNDPAGEKAAQIAFQGLTNVGMVGYSAYTVEGIKDVTEAYAKRGADLVRRMMQP